MVWLSQADIAIDTKTLPPSQMQYHLISVPKRQFHNVTESRLNMKSGDKAIAACLRACGDGDRGTRRRWSVAGQPQRRQECGIKPNWFRYQITVASPPRLVSPSTISFPFFSYLFIVTSENREHAAAPPPWVKIQSVTVNILIRDIVFLINLTILNTYFRRDRMRDTKSQN